MKEVLVTVKNADEIVLNKKCQMIDDTIWLDEAHKDKIISLKDRLIIEKRTDDTKIKIVLDEDAYMHLTYGDKTLEFKVTCDMLKITDQYIEAIYDTGEKIYLKVDIR